jgi:hypothetical protein
MRIFIVWILSIVFFTLTGLSPQQVLSAAIAEEDRSTSFSLGYGDTRLASIDRGQPRSERLNTTELSFTLDMGIRQRDAYAGMKVSNDSIVLDKGGGFEFDSFSLGFYAGVSF